MQETFRPETSSEEREFENRLRPGCFAEFIGQQRSKENLEIYVRAAKERGEALDHVLLSGPPGLGKTTLAGIIARELGVQFHWTSGPSIKRPGDLVGMLTGLEERDVLFIDEVHRLATDAEEYLYSAMEDYTIDVPIDTGPAARTVKFNLKHFTLVGATTKEGLLSRPFQDRFGIQLKLTLYTPQELAQIVLRAARILGVTCQEEAAATIARRSRGTPRWALTRHLRRLRDFAQVLGDGNINEKITREGLERLGVDELGLCEIDRHLLAYLARAGRPVGVKDEATAVHEEVRTVEDVYEPYLISEGYLLKTPRGRVITRKGYAALGLPALEQDPAVSQDSLF